MCLILTSDIDVLSQNRSSDLVFAVCQAGSAFHSATLHSNFTDVYLSVMSQIEFLPISEKDPTVISIVVKVTNMQPRDLIAEGSDYFYAQSPLLLLMIILI